MILINFAHPLTPEQLASVASLTGKPVGNVLDVKTQFDSQKSFAEQAQNLVKSVPLTSTEWQTLPLLINLPSLNSITALLLSELHGRAGYFPAVLRLRPITGTTPPQFEVAEILNLQAVREAARNRRD